jgi:sulfur carrier protein ThiS adenylyltransferase
MNPFEKSLSQFFDQRQLQRIQTVRVGIGGAGGIGSNVAILLTRCGFRSFTLLDHDVIEPSNLNRQQYYLPEIGQSKVAVLKKRLLKINPDLDICAHQVTWTPSAEHDYFENCRVIVEGFDAPATKKAFVEYYQPKGKHIVSASGFVGLPPENPLPVRRIQNMTIVGNQESPVSAHQPALAPNVTLCAAKMTEIILDLTSGLTREELE